VRSLFFPFLGALALLWSNASRSRRGWLELYLAGQTQARSWLDDRFHGITARAGFSF